MRVLIGDVLLLLHASPSNDETARKLWYSVYAPVSLDHLIRERLSKIAPYGTVFAYVFQNMPSQVVLELHAELTAHPEYLGAIDVDFSQDLHLAFFRNSLPEKLRFEGKKCAMIYVMSDFEDHDVNVVSILKENGFAVAHEDIGARGTIFDDFDTLDHFGRVEDFKRVFERSCKIASEIVSYVAYALEEVHPQLFDSLASFAQTFDRAQTAEDWAQVAISGRRFFEQLADCIFASRDALLNGRQLKHSHFVNRIMAYIDEAASNRAVHPANVDAAKKETKRLYEGFNQGLHGRITRQVMEKLSQDLMLWLKEIIQFDPAHFRQPGLLLRDKPFPSRSMERLRKTLASSNRLTDAD